MKKVLTVNIGLNAQRETNSGHVRSEIIESLERLNVSNTMVFNGLAALSEWRLANAPNFNVVWTDAGVLVVQVSTTYTEAHLLQRLVNLCDVFKEDAIAYTIADEAGQVYCKNLAYRSDYTKRYLFSDNLFVTL